LSLLAELTEMHHCFRRLTWQETFSRSPIAYTFCCSVDLDANLTPSLHMAPTRGASDNSRGWPPPGRSEPADGLDRDVLHDLDN